MRRRRRYRAPDGVDWRDPDMLVFKYADMMDGRGFRYVYVEPEKVHQLHAWRVTQWYRMPEPTYDRDPSYNWNRKIKKKLTDKS